MVHPVAILGPIIEQILDAQLKRPADFGYLFKKSTDWIQIWPPPPESPRLLSRAFRVEWDEVNKVARNKADVIAVQPRGGPRGFKAFDTGHLKTRLEGLGYVEGQSLIGHPYDWRNSVQRWKETSYKVLKLDIQRAVGYVGKKCVVATQSMGGPYFHTFMRWAGKRWVKKYIEAWVPIAAPLNGAINGLETWFAGLIGATVPTGCPACQPPVGATMVRSGFSRVSGLNWFKTKVNDFVTTSGVSIPGAYFLMPRPDCSQSPPEDRVVLKFNGKDILASEVAEVFKKLGDNNASSMLSFAQTFTPTTDPGIPVHCVIAHNVQTARLLDLDDKGKVTGLTNGDGDGTVNIESLEVCTRWKSTKKVYRLPNHRHSAALKSSGAASVLILVATNDEAGLEAWTKPPPGSGDVPKDQRFIKDLKR